MSTRPVHAGAPPSRSLTRRGSGRKGESPRYYESARSAGKTSAGTGWAPPPDTLTEIQKYVDEIAPSGITGRLIKFGKAGAFVTADDGEPVPESADFLALCAEVLIGWIRFYRDGETPPDRVCGLLYGGFILPIRSTLGDNDETQWEPGLSGQAEDPWKHQIFCRCKTPRQENFPLLERPAKPEGDALAAC